MKETHKGLIAWFARNSVAANLLMIVIIIAGISSVFSIKQQIFPELTFNSVTIRVPYLGAAPQEVETGVIEKIEEVLEDTNGIKKLTSTAVEGLGSVNIEVLSDYDSQEVMDEIKMRVDSISSFPEQIEKPTIYRQQFESNVIWLSIYGDLSERALKELANETREELKSISGVTKVTVVGARRYEVSIEVPEHKLREYGLTFEQVVTAVRNSSIDLPGGSIKSDNGNILLRTKGQAYQRSEFENITLITNADGTRLTVGDVTNVNDGFEEGDNFGQFDGKDSVSLRVDAVGDDNTLEIAQAVKDYVDERKKTLPETVNMAYWGDSSFYLQGRLDLMTSNMLLGSLLVLLILALFLEFKVAFWVMVGIPVCFLGAFALMPMEFADVSINMISLFAFILVLGIVVDDAIVMGESAYSEVEQSGMSVDSIITGVKRVAMPATFGVLTTIAAFVPLLLADGFLGAIFEAIAWVVIFCLIFSLIESKLILPAHLARMKVKKYEAGENGRLPLGKRVRDKVNQVLSNFVETRYQPFLELCISYRYATLMTFIGLLILTGGLLASGALRLIVFPNIPSDFIIGQVTMVEGTSDKDTNYVTDQVEEALLVVNQEYYEKYGEYVVQHSMAFNDGPASGQVIVELAKGENRELDGFEIVNQWREKVQEMPGVKNLQFQASVDGGGGGDIVFLLKSRSMDDLTAATSELKKELAAYSGVFDIRDSLSGGNDEIVLKLKPEAEILGITLADLARQVRYGFYGAEVQRVQRDREEVKVMVRYPKHERHSLGNLENMQIRTVTGDEVPFSSVASFDIKPSFATITRVNGERSVTVLAAVDKTVAVPSEVVKSMQDEVIPDILARYTTVQTALEGASKDEQDALVDLFKAMILAMFTIYALMAIPLKSYSQPLIIMSVIPFGLIGAMVGHLILGLSVSMLSLFGIIALAGVVVNDSLIMVDFVNKARAQGHNIKKAAVDAGGKRFRAIILTSLTTFFGLIPIVLEKSLQAKIVVPMAVSLAFGILFATVITLILIPALYVILEDLSQMKKRFYSALGFNKSVSVEDLDKV